MNRRLPVIILAVLILISTLPQARALEAIPQDKFVDPRLQGASGEVEVIVVLDSDTWALARAAGSPDLAVEVLQHYAAETQEPVAQYIEALGGEVVNRFWIVNALLVRIDAARLQDLVAYPSVEAVLLNGRDIHPVEPVDLADAGPSATVNWGVEAVNATGAWSLGYSGEGVRILVLDTGVYKDHVAFQDKLLTLDPTDPTYPGGWARFNSDGILQCTEPFDDDGHGTLAASEALGGDGSEYRIGVAPNATLMAAKIMDVYPDGTYGTWAQLLAGLQWAANPTTCDGTPTGLRPHIVSMSLGAANYTGTYILGALRTLLELNIVLVAAAGNDGPGTVDHPGNTWGVYAVGATDVSNNVASFSGGGLVVWPDPPSGWPFKPPYPSSYTKPDFTAPGVATIGAYTRSTTDFVAWSGTSAATPHLAGIVALVLEALEALNHTSPVDGKVLADVVYDVLVNASVDLGSPGMDDRYGYGLPDAGKAVTLARELSGPKTLTITLDPPAATVGEPVRVIGEATGFTVPNGTVFTVYFDSTPVDTVAWDGILYTVLTVPEAPRGAHTVAVESADGMYTGESVLEVLPSITLEGDVQAGSEAILRLYAHDPNTTYNILLDGATIIGTATTDSKGSSLATITIPGDTPPGSHTIETRDAGTGERLAQARVNVTSPQLEAPITRQILLVDVSGPLTVEAGDTVELYMVAYTPWEPANATINATLITPQGAGMLHVERLGLNMYRLSFNTTTEGYYTVHIQAEAAIGNLTLHAERVYTVHATPGITGMLGEIHSGVTSLQDTSTLILGKVDNVLDEVTATRSTLENMTGILELQYDAVRALEAGIHEASYNITSTIHATITEATANITQSISQANTTMAEGLRTVDSKLRGMLKTLTAIDNQVNMASGRLEGVESRLAGIEQGVNQTGARLAVIEGILAGINTSIGDIKSMLESIHSGIETLREETATGLQALGERADTIVGILAGQEQALEEIREELTTLGDVVSQAIASLEDAIRGLVESQQETNQTLASLEDKVEETRGQASRAWQAGTAAIVLSLAALGLGASRILRG